MAGRIEAFSPTTFGAPEDPALRAAEIFRNRQGIETAQIEQNRFDRTADERAAVTPLPPEGPAQPAAAPARPIDLDEFRAVPARNLNLAEVSPDEARVRFGIGEIVDDVDRGRTTEEILAEESARAAADGAGRLEEIAARGDEARIDQEAAVRRDEIGAPELAADFARRDQLLNEVSAEAQVRRSEELSALAGIAQNDVRRSPLLDIAPPPAAPPDNRPLIVEGSGNAARVEGPLARPLPPREANPAEIAAEEITIEAARAFGLGGIVNVAL